jgi:uncharacterized membrane protein YdbT with pleckstrin-like domain
LRIPMVTGDTALDSSVVEPLACHDCHMAYPRELLTGGEQVEYEMRQHWKFLAMPILATVVVVPLAVYLYALVDNSVLQWLVLLGALVLLIWWVITPLIQWLTTEYVITNRRVIMRSGVIRRTGRDMPLSKVNDVQFEVGLVERMLGCGTISIESAGERGGLVMRNVPDVESIQRDIARLHDEDDMRRRGTT